MTVPPSKKDADKVTDGFRGSQVIDAATVERLEVELRETREQLRESLWKTDVSNSRLAAIIESSDDAIISKNLDAVVTSWNGAAERLFGYTAEEMVGQPIFRIVPPDHPEDVFRILEAIKRGEKVGHFETVRVHKSGQLIPVSLTVSPIRDRAGKIIGASKIARDISERTRFERTRAHLAAIVDSAEDAIISKDLNGVIRSWNKGAEHLFGYTIREIVGLPVTLLIPADRQDEEPQILARIRLGERVEHFETMRVTKRGRLIPVSLTISPIKDNAGNVIGASKIARDISERKQIDEALQRGLRLRDEFISIASHELKTPLTSIKLQTEIIKRNLARQGPQALTPERIVRLVDQTDKQVERLSRLVDDMLDASRIGSGRLSLQFEPVALAALARETIDDLADYIEAAGCSMIEEFDAEVVGRWDRHRIEQVIINLLTNACRYGAGKPVAVRVFSDGTDAVLEVQDQGIGIAEDDQARIFERFERASSSVHGGFGIGLYILREVVHAHAGNVSVESAPGKGAIFRVRLPKGAVNG
ncbi:MAG TPA: PAS domain-containing sensor histidine kinase [Burkholderiales bacterium]|nr:PAS domain-containing sensor histidine kinase [Burkholderiales bacterium]